jgi:hypothetical protein
MKKILLTISAVALSAATYAQVIVAGISPQSIVANYTHTWADPASGWGTPDFLIPNTFVEDTLMLVDDGTPGTNAQGHPIAQEGCNPLINNLTGKIAVIYRNTCNFSLKAFNAQTAGAVGVIIINRDPEAVGMGAGTGSPSGINVTIPVVMLSSTDGAALVNAMANGPVVVFMGNKQNLYETDGGSSLSDVMISKYGSIPLSMANNDYSFDPGIQVYNFGSEDHEFTINATLTAPGGTVVYDNTVGPVTILSADTLAVFNGNPNSFPPVTLSSWQVGKYTLTYTIDIPGFTDSANSDNVYVSYFDVTSDVLSLASQDNSNSSLLSNSFPSNATSSYKVCMKLQDVYPSMNTGVEGLYFSIQSPNDTVIGEEVIGEIFEWNDPWTDLSNGFGSITFDNLNQVGGFNFDYTDNAQNEQVVYAAFPSPILLLGDQRYLVCVTTSNPEIGFGFDKTLNYDANVGIYSQPVMAMNIDNTDWYSGWSGGTNAAAIGLKIITNVGIEENAELIANAYPNPANDLITVIVNASGKAHLTVTDISGKVAISGALNLAAGQADVNLDALQAGLYIFNVTLENGKTAQFNVVKK